MKIVSVINLKGRIVGVLLDNGEYVDVPEERLRVIGGYQIGAGRNHGR